MQYVPAVDTLKLVLSNKEVMDYITRKSKTSEEGVLSSFEDGKSFKTNTFFQKYSDALGLHLYYDEFLVNNPFGTKTHKQKISAFYFSISNLPPHLQNYLGNVHVLGIGKEADVKFFKIN